MKVGVLVEIIVVACTLALRDRASCGIATVSLSLRAVVPPVARSASTARACRLVALVDAPQSLDSRITSVSIACCALRLDALRLDVSLLE